MDGELEESKPELVDLLEGVELGAVVANILAAMSDGASEGSNDCVSATSTDGSVEPRKSELEVGPVE